VAGAIVSDRPTLGPPDGVDEVLPVPAVAEPGGDESPGRLIGLGRGVSAGAPGDAHRPLCELRKVVEVPRLFAPGRVNRLAGGDLEGDVLYRAVVARGEHHLKARELGPKAIDDALVARRLPAVRLIEERIGGIGQFCQAFRAFGHEARNQVAQHRRLAGPGRSVDGEKMAGGTGHRHGLVDGKLLPERQRSVRAGGPATERDAIGIGGATDLIESGTHIDPAADVDLGARSQVIAQRGSDLSSTGGDGDASEIVGDEAVEEVLVDYVGAPPRDDVAANPDALDGKHPIDSKRLGGRRAALGERGPLEHHRLLVVVTKAHLLELRREVHF
jgi:hypothetical protein